MHSIGEEMMDGLGIQELASCVGLSESQVEKVLSHSHERNNGGVLFNLACPMKIHLIYMTAIEEPIVAEAVKSLHESSMQRAIVPDSSGPQSGRRTTKFKSSQKNFTPVLASTYKTSAYRRVVYNRTTEVFTDDMFKVGKIMRENAAALLQGAEWRTLC